MATAAAVVVAAAAAPAVVGSCCYCLQQEKQAVEGHSVSMLLLLSVSPDMNHEIMSNCSSMNFRMHANADDHMIAKTTRHDHGMHSMLFQCEMA